MTKQISHELVYDAPIDAVTAMLADPEFRREVCAHLRVSEVEVSVERRADGALEVTVDQRRPTERMPSFAKRLAGTEIRIVQHEVWSSPTSADIDVTIPGKPGEMRGTANLAERDGRTVETVQLTVKVSIPLVGGKLEDLIGGLLVRALEGEQKVGVDYLSR